MRLIKFACLFHMLISTASAARIFALFPIHGISNYNAAENLLRALAEHGHDVTVVTSFPRNYSLPNFHQIDVSRAKGLATNNLNYERVKKVIEDVKSNFMNMQRLSRTYCEVTFKDDRVKALMNQKFDLVINAIFGSDCDAGFAWKFNAPLISILNARHTPWSSERVGNPSNPSYIRVIHSRAPAQMNFFQRLDNTIWYLYFLLTYNIRNNGPDADKVSATFFGPKVSSVKDLTSNTSMVFVNTHFSVDEPIPLVPNCIEVAGLHIQKPKPLPTNIQKFMDGAKDGVIYFTLGSMVRTSSLPKKIVNAFRDAFAEIPQRVLWKFELEMDDIPKNVLINSWMPQNDIFNHPNIRAFISHGGNSGSIEAVHYGIPLIGIPLFYDQYRNILSFVEKGVAVMLDINDLNKENILNAIQTVINDNRYSTRMKKLSALFKDRPMSALDTAIYWTEYVIRHNGAPHLRTTAIKLSWYQYLLLDVIGFILLVVYITYKITAKVLCCVLGYFCCNSSKKQKNIPKKKKVKSS